MALGDGTLSGGGMVAMLAYPAEFVVVVVMDMALGDRMLGGGGIVMMLECPAWLLSLRWIWRLEIGCWVEKE